MDLKELLSHHGITTNPFSEEDARSDQVFKRHCIDSTYHPCWDKIYGDPAEPSTAIVFGEKGSGKTALRLQIAKQVGDYNKENPKQRCFVVSYDDFNPFLDNFRERFSRKKADKVLREYQLWDHIDAILSLAVTKLIDGLFKTRSKKSEGSDHDDIPADFRKRLTTHQRRDLLLLAAIYDDSKAAPQAARWRRLRSRLKDWKLRTWVPFLLGLLVTAAAIGLAIYGQVYEKFTWTTFYCWLSTGAVIAAWLPWIWRTFSRLNLANGIRKNIRIVNRDAWPLSRTLAKLTGSQLSDQPLPNKQRTDDRYSLLGKFQSILASLDFSGMTVLVDRIDEPHLINGSSDAMKDFIWPLLDNKFLQQPGMGLKFMLPDELNHFIEREDRDFYQRARLDKQNVVPSLDWTGQALFDLANARLAACSDRETPTRLNDLMDEKITEQRLFDALQSLRVPRHVFKFLFRAINAHCNRHSDSNPEFRMSSDVFESELAIYRRDQEAADRGMGA